MVAYLDSNPDIGAAGPKLVLPDGSLDLACRRSLPTIEVSLWRFSGLSKLFPHHKRFAQYNLTYLDENEITEVGSVVGAFMMVRREVIEKVGLLDETFFMYGEDLDWSKRVAEAGWKVMYYPKVEVSLFADSGQLLCTARNRLVAVVANHDVSPDVAVFRQEDIPRFVDWVEREFLRGQGPATQP